MQIILNNGSLIEAMKTVLCPLCEAPLHIVFKMDKIEGWKKCNACHQPVYMTVTSDGDSSTVSLKELIDNIVKTKPGVEMLKYLLKQDGNAMQDIVFTAGGVVKKDVEFLTEMHVLEKTIRGYSIKEGLKPFIEEQVQPYLEKEKADIFRDFI